MVARADPHPLERFGPGLEGLARPVHDLREDPANARTHDERNLAAIRKSLEAFGQRKPIVVRDGVVVAGNGTLRAAHALGWQRIAVVEADDLSAEEATAYAVADNRTAELAAWDIEALRAAVATIEATCGGLDALALAPADLDAIARELNRRARSGFGEDQPITVAARPEEVHSRLGEVYELGPHLLLCGDSTDPVQVARLFGDGKKAALFATDPPYLIGYRGGVGTSPGGRKDWSALSPDPVALDPEVAPAARSGHRRGKDWGGIYHEGAKDGDGEGFHLRYASAVRPHLREDAAWYCFHADARADYLARAWAELGVYWHMTAIWVKPTFVLGGTLYHYQHEPCAVGWVRPHMPRRLGTGSESSVWALGWGPDGTAAKNVDCPDHPTCKPLGVWRIPMLKHTEPGEVCYEPFGGSGSQLIAAATLGRVVRAVEIEPVFCDVIRRRWTAWARTRGLDPGPGALELVAETSS
jgi:DNA modification methylase